MKKLLIILLALLALTGCSNVQNGEVKETKTVNLYKGSITDLLDEKTNSKYMEVYEGRYPDEMLPLIGEELPDVEYIGYDGNTYTLPKNEVYLLEVVGSWCHFCQDFSKESMNDLLDQNQDIKIFQYFFYGLKEDVDGFYATIEKEIPENLTVLVSNDKLEEWLDKRGLSSVPLFFVVGENGLVEVPYLGYSDVGTFNSAIELAKQAPTNSVLTNGEVFKDFIKEQNAAKKYIDNLESVNVPLEYFE